MYGGSAYAAVPYAGGSATATAPGPVLPGPADAAYLLVGGGIYIEQDHTAPLPEAGTHRYVVALVYPTWEPGTGSSGGTIGGGGFTPEGYGVGAFGFGPYGE